MTTSFYHQWLGRLSMACLMLCATLGNAEATDALVLDKQIVKPGKAKTMIIKLRNEAEYAGFQLDILLPKGLTIPANTEGLPDVTLAQARSNGHSISASYYAEQTVRVLAISSSNNIVKGEDGALLYVKLDVAGDYAGEGGITLKNIKFSDKEARQTIFADVTAAVVPPQQCTVQMSLAEGWNWVSQNTENTKDFVTFMQPFGKPTTVERIMSDTQEMVNDQHFGLVGNLTTFTPEKGYRVQISAATEYVAEPGTWCWPDDYPITLYKGWNWIGYLPYKTMPTTDALAGLTPQENDRIIGFDGFADYKDGKWIGTLTEMTPGAAYHYYAQSNTVFSYPTSYPADEGAHARAAEASPDSPWSYDAHHYPDVTTVIARLTDGGQAAQGWVVGAFCGDECRGISSQVGDLLFINIHGTVSAHETIHFTAYHSESNRTVELDGTLPFDGSCLGHVDEPISLSLNYNMTTVSEKALQPFTVELKGNCLTVFGDADEVTEIRLFTMGGVLLQASPFKHQRTILRNHLPRGVYSVALTLKDGKTIVRKVTNSTSHTE